MDDRGYFTRTLNNREIEGWRQKSLDSGTMCIFGDDVLTSSVLKSLAGLSYGVGKEGGQIAIIPENGSSKNTILGKNAHQFRHNLTIINPYLDISIGSRDADIYLLLSNDLSSKEKALQSIPKGSRVISASTSGVDGSIITGTYPDIGRDELMLEDYHGREQFSLTSGFLTPLILEEVRRHHFSLCYERMNSFTGRKEMTEDAGLEGRVNISRFRRQIFTQGKIEHDALPVNKDQSDLHLLYVGAGGVGTFNLYYSLCDLAELFPGRRIVADVYDPDTTAEHNLYAQIFYYGCIENIDNKATVISERLGGLNDIVIRPHVEALTYAKLSSLGSEFDFIHSNVDDNAAASGILRFAAEHSLPAVRGTISEAHACAEFYPPGEEMPELPIIPKLKEGCGGITIFPTTIMMNEFAGVADAHLQTEYLLGIETGIRNIRYSSRAETEMKIQAH